VIIKDGNHLNSDYSYDSGSDPEGKNSLTSDYYLDYSKSPRIIQSISPRRMLGKRSALAHTE